MAQLNFDASTVAPQEAFDPIPAGWYPAQIVESEMKAGSKPGSSYLAITLQIMGGDFNNRKVFDRFRATVQEHSFPQVGHVTVSIGFVSASQSTPVEILGKADQALYFAKENGRNQVRYYDDLVAQGHLQARISHDDVELF